MKKFIATKYEDNVIELTKSEQIDELYNVITDEEDFIIQWSEGETKKARLIIATDWASKLKTNDIIITASQSKA